MTPCGTEPLVLGLKITRNSPKSKTFLHDVGWVRAHVRNPTAQSGRVSAPDRRNILPILSNSALTITIIFLTLTGDRVGADLSYALKDTVHGEAGTYAMTAGSCIMHAHLTPTASGFPLSRE